MWIERRMRSGPGRRRQTRRPALLDAIGEDRPGPWCAPGVHRRARRPPASSNPFGASPPFRRGCHPPPEREQESRPGPDSRRRAIARTNRNRSRRAHARGRRRPDHGPSRSVPRNDRSPVGLRPRNGWRYASRDRTHRSARDWQRYVVGKVRLSPRTAQDPGRRRWWSRDPEGRGSPCRGGSCHLRSGVLARPDRLEVRTSQPVGPLTPTLAADHVDRKA
jgi:hypothetical protein